MIVAIFPGKTEGLEKLPELVHWCEAGEVQTDYDKTAIFNVSFDSGENFLCLLIGFSKAFVCYNNCFEGVLGHGSKRGGCGLCALDVSRS